VTLSALVPTLAVQLAELVAEQRRHLGSLQVLQVGGARLLPHAATQLRAALGCTVQQVYGMAEGLLNFTRLDDPAQIVVETQGRPASTGDELRIVDESGHEVADGQPGELWTRGPYTIAGYYRAEEFNRTALTLDGFYRTGDVVSRHPSGNLVVEGRRKRRHQPVRREGVRGRTGGSHPAGGRGPAGRRRVHTGWCIGRRNLRVRRASR